MLLERTGERLGGKLRSLIGVEDLWRAVADNGFFHRFDAKGGVHRVREPVGERLTAMPVDYGHKIEKAFRHRDVRNVRRIDLPGSLHLHASEQIRINPVPVPGRRRAALRVDGPKAHEANDAASGDLAPACLEHALDRARSARGTFHVEPVDLFHRRKVLFTLCPGTIVGRRTTQRKEPRLANHRQRMRGRYLIDRRSARGLDRAPSIKNPSPSTTLRSSREAPLSDHRARRGRRCGLG